MEKETTENIKNVSAFAMLLCVLFVSGLGMFIFYKYHLIEWLTPNNASGKVFLVLSALGFGVAMFFTTVRLIDKLGFGEWLGT